MFHVQFATRPHFSPNVDAGRFFFWCLPHQYIRFTYMCMYMVCIYVRLFVCALIRTLTRLPISFDRMVSHKMGAHYMCTVYLVLSPCKYNNNNNNKWNNIKIVQRTMSKATNKVLRMWKMRNCIILYVVAHSKRDKRDKRAMKAVRAIRGRRKRESILSVCCFVIFSKGFDVDCCVFVCVFLSSVLSIHVYINFIRLLYRALPLCFA